MMCATSEFDLRTIIASVSGALCFILNSRCFGRKQKPIAFFISFSMGIIGADLAVDLINNFIPGVYTNERALGAFVCSALIITVCIRLTSLIDSVLTRK